MSIPFAYLAPLRGQVEYKFWATPGHLGQTLADLTAKMEEIGNTVLEVDEVNNRLLVAQTREEGPVVYGCSICFHTGQIVIFDQESEMKAHYLDVHGEEI